ncbi:MAG: phosphotransferase [Candidatus Rokubacteria bacterium]|nr:phosphotransferase [Candidatus Rokubacteria bacterium]
MIEEFLLASWPDLSTEPRPRRLRLLRLGARSGGRSSVSWLVFCNDREIPSFLVKVSSDPSYREGIDREYRNFSTIYLRLRSCRATVPRPLLCADLNGRRLLCETVVLGRPLGGRTFRHYEWYRRYRVSRFVSCALEWLSLFHAETNVGEAVIDDCFIDRAFKDTVRRVMERFASTLRGYEPDLEELPRRAVRFLGTRIPIGAVHGDFTHANVLLREDSVAVVDWEDCQSSGPPFRDLFFLACQLALDYYGTMAEEESFRRFFLQEGGGGDLVLRLMEGYAREAGFDPRLLLLMLPQFLGEMLLSELPEHRARETFLFASVPCIRVALELQRRIWQ